MVTHLCLFLGRPAMFRLPSRECARRACGGGGVDVDVDVDGFGWVARCGAVRCCGRGGGGGLGCWVLGAGCLVGDVLCFLLFCPVLYVLYYTYCTIRTVLYTQTTPLNNTALRYKPKYRILYLESRFPSRGGEAEDLCMD